MYRYATTVIIFSLTFVISSSQSLLSLLEERVSGVREEDYSIEINREFESDFKYDVLATKDNHIAAFIQCQSLHDGYQRDTNPECNLTLSTRAFRSEKTTKYCMFQRIPEKHASLGEFKVLNSDRVLVHWKEDASDENTYMLYQIMTSDLCKSSNIFNVTTRSYPSIVRRKNNFDIIFNKSPHCQDDAYCRQTYNLDGVPEIKGYQILHPSMKSFYINFIQASDYESDDGLFVIVSRNDEAGTLMIISPNFGSKKHLKEIEGMNSGYGFVYTNISGTATLCGLLQNEDSKTEEKLRCVWLNKNETDVNRLIDLDFNNFDANNIRIYSSKPGKIIIIRMDDHSNNILMDKIHSNGKCRRLKEIASKKMIYFDVSINKDKEYCLAYIEDSSLPDIFKRNKGRSSTRSLKFVSKCFKPNKSSYEINTCGRSHVKLKPIEKLTQDFEGNTSGTSNLIAISYIFDIIRELVSRLFSFMWRY